MAESAVSFVLEQISVFLLEERQLLGGLEREIVFIQDEMRQMNEFLHTTNENKTRRKEWIRQLREIAYSVEDVLDEYKLRFGQRRVATGFRGCIIKVHTPITNLKARHQIASEIQDIKYRLQNVFTGQQRYKDKKGSSSKKKWYDGRGDALFLDEVDVVGIEAPKRQLLEWIDSMDDGLEVISVVGMGGLGKTTLVKKVYDDESVKRRFNHHVWIVASDYKNVKHMLTILVRKLVAEIKEAPPANLGEMSVGEMGEYIFGFLRGKSYILGVDDVWDISTWNAIRVALPKRRTHGCVIIATRSRAIANAACSETNHVYELQPLPEEESRKLFYSRAFPRDQACPDYIREYADHIMETCEGLPLAITTISGLLATKENHIEEWEVFERSFVHELKGGGSLELLGKSLFSLSYNDLPYYLKYCYLYLSIFLENSVLEKETIIRLWISEGFVQPKEDKTMEEVALEYLNDLFSRSLIQVAKRHVDGRPRAFRIHFLLRDYMISKSREHNVVTISNGGEMQQSGVIRRLAIQKNLSVSPETCNLDRLRSLLWSSNLELGLLVDLAKRCRRLKVLDLRGAPLEAIPNEVFKLYHLKYLSLRNTMVRIISKSIKYLENLETLDLKNCFVIELPVEILNLHKLRHLLVYKYKGIVTHFDSIQSFKAPCDIGTNLKSLVKISSIDANEVDGISIVREIGKLTQLRRLGIAKLRNEDGKELCSSIAKLLNLRSLRIDSVEENEALDLDYPVTNLQFLRSLTLKGSIPKVPTWIRSLKGLTTLGLYWSKLKEDPMSSLQDLPNLTRLYIHGAHFEELKFRAGGFKKLKEVWLRELACLKRVIVEKGSMSSLREWTMSDSKLLTELPQGMEHLRHLQVVVFGKMANEFVENVSEEEISEGDNWRLAHVPKVRFGNVVDDGYWRIASVL